MIKVSSNINSFLKHYKKKVEAFKASLDDLAYKLAQKMSSDMAYEIASLRYVWTEEGNLDKVSGVDFNIVKTSETSVRVTIGDSLPKITVGDSQISRLRGRVPQEVNPVYFIEFGFGIAGERNPQKNHEEHGWEYNINQHKSAWFYYDSTVVPAEDGSGEWKPPLLRSEGRQGINFMYNTIEKYRGNWLMYVSELIKENYDG